MTKTRKLTSLLLSQWLSGTLLVAQAQGPLVGLTDLQSAIAAGKIDITYRGTGASSGDSIMLHVSRSMKPGPSPFPTTIPPGSLLDSGNAAYQDMIVMGIRGRVADGKITRASVISDPGSSSATYVLSAFCANFDRANPPESSLSFRLLEPRPVFACIAREGQNLSIEAMQAAIWMQSDNITYSRMNARFPIGQADWIAGEKIFQKCQPFSESIISSALGDQAARVTQTAASSSAGLSEQRSAASPSPSMPSSAELDEFIRKLIDAGERDFTPIMTGQRDQNQRRASTLAPPLWRVEGSSVFERADSHDYLALTFTEADEGRQQYLLWADALSRSVPTWVLEQEASHRVNVEGGSTAESEEIQAVGPNGRTLNLSRVFYDQNDNKTTTLSWSFLVPKKREVGSRSSSASPTKRVSDIRQFLSLLLENADNGFQRIVGPFQERNSVFGEQYLARLIGDFGYEGGGRVRSEINVSDDNAEFVQIWSFDSLFKAENLYTSIVRELATVLPRTWSSEERRQSSFVDTISRAPGERELRVRLVTERGGSVILRYKVPPR